MSKSVLVIDGDGRFFIPVSDALRMIKEGDAEPVGEFSVRLLAPVLRGVRGPSCAVQGVAHGKAADGRVKLSYLERLALGVVIRERNADGLVVGVVEDYAVNLEEIGAIHHRVLSGATA